MNRLKQITTKAKALYKTGKFAKWTDAIKQASKSLGATKSGSHKDTRSHNVNVKVVSGTKQKSVGAVKIIQKGETPKSRVTKVLQQIRTKKGTFKGYKKIGSVNSDNAKQLILNNIDGSDYGETLNTPDEKIRFVEKTFLTEYGWAVARMGKQRAIEEWLRGLPIVLTLPFWNEDILNLAIQWGALKPNATERQEDKILANYWKLMASQLLQMMNKRKLNKKFY